MQMGATKVVSSHVLIVISSAVVLFLSLAISIDGNEGKELKICGFDAIYNFGDSFSDTENAIHIMPGAPQSRPPNGISIQKTTGRFCDGLLLIDYIANSAGFRSIKAYLNSNETESSNAANFAVAGSTALPPNVLLSKLNLQAGFINNSLNGQLQWFGEYLKRFCQIDCKEKLKSSLFIFGVGTNDYGQALFLANKTIEDVKKMRLVFEVVETIQKAIEQVIGYGATRVLVPGCYPMGCAPGFLGSFRNSNHTKDKLGCLKEFNDFFKYHNDHLRAALKMLREISWCIYNFRKFGFETITEACCGGPGNTQCGQDKSLSCKEPQKHIFWDGIHPTQNANKNLANLLIKDFLSKFECRGC